MKIFLDSAHVETIRRLSFLIDGVTTNPTTLSSYGTNPTQLVRNICELLDQRDVSIEVTMKDPGDLLKQARAIAALAPNVVVKVPCHEPYYALIKALVKETVRVNVTLVFSLAQAVLMAKLGVAYISPFVGRWSDAGVDGIEILHQMRKVFDRYSFQTQILAASIRDVYQFELALCAGVDAITLPPAVLELAMVHPLTKQGMDKFDFDWRKLGDMEFPL